MTHSTPTAIPPDVRISESVAELQASPIETTAEMARGGAHVVGAFSIETFCDQGSLSYTHEDAQGFLQWLQGFNVVPNFWFRDGAVKVWAYGEQYDNWQDTYGMDANLISYHSGHGGMDAGGVFYVPMGAAWAGNDCTATSNNMALGNEYCRYAFWSTCTSLRVLDGHNPIRTWHPANKGLRMIFGFETVSWDSTDYGKNFGRHWNAGESLSSAWLNASWDIAHDQAPSVVACGATAAEAQDRLNNERAFSWPTASSAYYQWRWYNVAASAQRERNLDVPTEPVLARLAPATSVFRQRAERFGFDASQVTQSAIGYTATDGRRRLTQDSDGVLIAQLAEPNRENRSPLTATEAQTVAADALQRHGLDYAGPTALDRIVPINEAGAASRKGSALEGPYQIGTLVQFRQLINDVPIITPDAGTLQVIVDNDGVATSIAARARTVDELREQPFGAPVTEPTPPGRTESTPNGRRVEARGQRDPEQLLARAFSDLLRSLAIKGAVPIGFNPVPGTKEIGYDVRGDLAVLVVQRAIELDFGQGFKKRYWIKAPLFG
jgi:hypothetical protein